MAAHWSKVAFRLLLAQSCRTARQYCTVISTQKKINGVSFARLYLSLSRRFSILNLKRSFSALETRLCWQCTNEISAESLLCKSCGMIQSIEKNANYFKLFEIKQCFSINTMELSIKFKAMQGLLHPDKFAGKSEREQRYSSECSSFLNAAYNTLLQPLERGEYLLRLDNQEILETGMEMNQEFLMEVMEINELLAETRLSRQKLKLLDEENKLKVKDTIVSLTKVFQDNSLEEAKILLAKLKYYINIENKIKELEIEFGIVH